MSNVMISTDPIADMLARIRNAAMVRKAEVVLPYSKAKAAIAQLLAANGFIQTVQESGEGTTKTLILTLSTEGASSPITEITRLSKPGRRHYVRSQEIPVVRRGRGMVLVSTSKGLMTGADARTQGLGGELICKVY